MRTAFYPGTFDPITTGHLDLIERALRLFDRVIVAVGTGRDKVPMFSREARIEFVEDAVKDLSRVSVRPFDGLLVDAVKEAGANAIIRGLRAVSDFEYEFQMALMNRRLDGSIETVFLMPSKDHTYLNSTVVKEVARLGGDVSGLVPEKVERALRDRAGFARD
ncbi:MAG: pantetheine-phosphate adenylyltransferase [Candidatus Eisenbacteria bacterium]|nr:pantetheine-phosphate adenylyltransferase [Candidatus Eisenbacteria bacterium]